MAKNRKKAGRGDQLKGAKPEQEKGKGLEARSTPKSPAPRKSPAERREAQIEGIKKTVYPSIIGVIAGFACYYSLGVSTVLPWHFVVLVVIGATYFIQKLTYPFLGIDVAEFQAKDWLYVEFMAVDLWLVSWTLLLN
jgi:phage shock protein PspC (stress-responsive transcriptional regulator)